MARRGPHRQHRPVAARRPQPGPPPRRLASPLLPRPPRLDGRLRRRRRGRAGVLGGAGRGRAAPRLARRPPPGRAPGGVGRAPAPRLVAVRHPLRHRGPDVLAHHRPGAGRLPCHRHGRRAAPPLAGRVDRARGRHRRPAADPLLVVLPGRGRCRVPRRGRGAGPSTGKRGARRRRRPGSAGHRHRVAGLPAVDPRLPLPGGQHGHAVGPTAPAPGALRRGVPIRGGSARPGLAAGPAALRPRRPGHLRPTGGGRSGGTRPARPATRPGPHHGRGRHPRHRRGRRTPHRGRLRRPLRSRRLPPGRPDRRPRLRRPGPEPRRAVGPRAGDRARFRGIDPLRRRRPHVGRRGGRGAAGQASRATWWPTAPTSSGRA